MEQTQVAKDSTLEGEKGTSSLWPKVQVKYLFNEKEVKVKIWKPQIKRSNFLKPVQSYFKTTIRTCPILGRTVTELGIWGLQF